MCGQLCQVCKSPNVAEYDKLLLEGWEIKEVWRKAVTEYNESFSYESMRGHYHRDVIGIIEAKKKRDRIRENILEEEIQKDIVVAQQIRNDLELLNNMLNTIKENIEDKESRREILSIVSKIHDTLELLLRFADQLQLKPRITEEELYEKFIKAMSDFPSEYIMKFMERIKSVP